MDDQLIGKSIYHPGGPLTDQNQMLGRTSLYKEDGTPLVLPTNEEMNLYYAPKAVDQFVDPFPSWFGGGTVNQAIASIVGKIQGGAGAPNGVVIGSIGDRYVDRSATLGARVWYKATGTNTNTGWVVVEGDTGVRSIGTC